MTAAILGAYEDTLSAVRRGFPETLNEVVAMKTASIERADFIAYPTNRVVGTVSDAAKAQAAIDALLQAGFPAA